MTAPVPGNVMHRQRSGRRPCPPADRDGGRAGDGADAAARDHRANDRLAAMGPAALAPATAGRVVSAGRAADGAPAVGIQPAL